MPDARPESVLEWDGAAAPPRRNGELVFASLWESRVFGMTMSLHEQGAFHWNEFRDRLIAAIAAWERAARDAPSHPAEYRYWDCWLTAFEALVTDKGLCPPAALEARIVELAARPAGHDHRAKDDLARP